MPGQGRFLTNLLFERWLPWHMLVCALPMSRSPVGDASRNRDIQEDSRAGREMKESGQHLIAMRFSYQLAF